MEGLFKRYDFTPKYFVAEQIKSPMATTIEDCRWCGGHSMVTMTESQFQKWLNKSAFVQEIFPDVPMDQREVMISGTHPECWIEMFGGDEDE